MRGLGHLADELRAVLSHGADDQVGPADVNPDDVAHRSPRFRPSPARRADPADSDDVPGGRWRGRAANRGGNPGPVPPPRDLPDSMVRSQTPAGWARKAPPSACPWP